MASGFWAALNRRGGMRSQMAVRRPQIGCQGAHPLDYGCALWLAGDRVCETADGYCTSIHHAESLTFSLWRLTGAVNGWPVEHAARPHRSGGAWPGTVAVTPRSGRLRADSLQAGYRADEPQCRYGYVGGHASEARTTSRNQLNAV